MGDTQTHLDLLREGERSPITAATFHRQADDVGGSKLEAAFGYQIAGNYRIEKVVVKRIVDMAIDVVVRPPRADGGKMRVVIAAGGSIVFAHYSVTISALNTCF